MTTGEQLRLDGIGANLAAATAPHRVPYLDYATAALRELIESRRPFTVDDLRARIPPEAGEPHSPNVLPSLIGAAASRRVIRRIGSVNSTRPTRHASRNAEWIGTESE